MGDNHVRGASRGSSDRPSLGPPAIDCAEWSAWTCASVEALGRLGQGDGGVGEAVELGSSAGLDELTALNQVPRAVHEQDGRDPPVLIDPNHTVQLAHGGVTNVVPILVVVCPEVLQLVPELVTPEVGNGVVNGPFV